MNRKNRIIYLGFLFMLILSLVSCVTPITPHLNGNDSKPLLVVEGQITDQEGPFKVKLTTTVPVGDIYTPTPVLNADVKIVDDQGHTFQLIGTGNGLYETVEKNLKAVPGYRYTLTITTLEDGVQYTSTPVLMQEVPDIDNLYFEEVTHTRLSEGLSFEDTWLNVLLDTHDADGKNKYWQFRFEETWEINLLADPVKVNHSLQYPENFSKWFIVPIDDKKVCWVTKPSSSILIATTDNQSQDQIIRFPVQSIGPNDTRLHIRYSILVKQYSIHADLYKYWNQLKDFNESSGGLYNKIPYQVFGNISGCDGTTKALGYFSASSVKEKRLFINRSEIHLETININEGCTYFTYDVPPAQQKIYFGPDILSGQKAYTSSTGCADCTEFGTNVKPSFW